jgi:hypothetical protein
MAVAAFTAPVLSLAAGSVPAAAATKTVPPKVGATCSASKLGQVVVVAGKRLVCAKSGSKRMWIAALPPVPTGGQTSVAPTVPSLVYRDDFANINGDWPTLALPAGTAGYREEKYQLLARRAPDPVPLPGQGTTIAPSQAPAYLGVRAPGVANVASVTIDIEAKLISSGGAFAIGCYDNGSVDDSTRYEGVVTHDDKWILNEVRNGKPSTLAAGDLQLNVLRRGNAPNQLRLSCVGAPGGPGRVSLVLNDQTIAQKAITAMLPGGQVSIWSIAYLGVPGSQVVYNNISVIRA